MRFQPENVLLKHEDFDGFTVGKNPLLAGARALSDYWMKISLRSGGREPEPYILLIVRPSGAKYYAARRLLEPLGRPFGYELVEESLPLEIPKADPVATELCKRAVEEVLKEREDLQRLIVSRGPESLSRNPNYRVIRKPGGGFEVEYDPHGHPAEGDFGDGPDPFAKNPLGSEGFDSPATEPGEGSGGGSFHRPDSAGAGGSPLVTRLPEPGTGGGTNYGSGTGRATGPQGSGTSRRGETSPGTLGTGRIPSAEPFAASQPGNGFGTRNREPHLLPDDLIRRSRGQLPYNGQAGPPTPSMETHHGTQAGPFPGAEPQQTPEQFGRVQEEPGQGGFQNDPKSEKRGKGSPLPADELPRLGTLGRTGPTGGGAGSPDRKELLTPEELINRSPNLIADPPANGSPSSNRSGEPGPTGTDVGSAEQVPDQPASPGQRPASQASPNRVNSPHASGQTPPEMPLTSADPNNHRGTPSNLRSFGRPSQSQSPSSSPPSEPPSMANQPPMPNFFNLNSRRQMENRTTPYQRRWGLSDPRASIGFEREVTIRVEPNRLVVGDAFAVSFDEKTTKDQLSAGMLEAVERKVRTWGQPPRSFYWVPTIHFQSPPTGMPIYQHMNATAKTWGLETVLTETRN